MLTNLGNSLSNIGRTVEALAYWEKAIQKMIDSEFDILGCPSELVPQGGPNMCARQLLMIRRSSPRSEPDVLGDIPGLCAARVLASSTSAIRARLTPGCSAASICGVGSSCNCFASSAESNLEPRMTISASRLPAQRWKGADPFGREVRTPEQGRLGTFANFWASWRIVMKQRRNYKSRPRIRLGIAREIAVVGRFRLKVDDLVHEHGTYQSTWRAEVRNDQRQGPNQSFCWERSDPNVRAHEDRSKAS